MRGGYRPGAGRPKGAQTSPNCVLEALPAEHDPLAYLLSVMRDPQADLARRDRAAIAALPYVHPRPSAPTKAEQKRDDLAAEQAQLDAWAARAAEVRRKMGR